MRPSLTTAIAARCCATGALLAALGWVLLAQVAAQEPQQTIVRRPVSPGMVSASADLTELRQLDARVDAMARTDALELTSRLRDRQLPGRTHEYFQQYYQGVPVYGGGVSRQLRNGVTVSIAGTLHETIDIATIPAISADDALAQMEAWSGAGRATDVPELVILPLLVDRYVLAYHAPMRDRMRYFVNAHTGAVVWTEPEFDEQSAVGVGHGIQGQRKKVSASRSGGVFQAHDRLRPAEIVTLDLQFDVEHADMLLDPMGPEWVASDVASDSDNDWTDPGVVDVHTYAGFTYDYLYSRHDWQGADGSDGRIMTMVNVSEDPEAFFIPPPFGPEKSGVVAFGLEPDGTPAASLDIVAHELMHAVTYHSVRARTGSRFRSSLYYIEGPSSFTTERGSRADCDTVWRVRSGPLAARPFHLVCNEDNGRILLFINDGGAINEAFSDIVGTSVEFMFHEPAIGPLRADYEIAEDSISPFRSLKAPQSIPIRGTSQFDYPDALRRGVHIMLLTDGESFLFHQYGSTDLGDTIVPLPTAGYSGVHWNSTILSHAFYLAIEGGENRTTGLSVDGVGGANREQVERAFVRAMTELMPASVSFFQAADVIRQSAEDLYGRDSEVYRAIDEAFTAVDLD